MWKLDQKGTVPVTSPSDREVGTMTRQARSTPEALYSQLWASALPLGSMAAGDKCICRAHVEPVTAEANQGGHMGGEGSGSQAVLLNKAG